MHQHHNICPTPSFYLQKCIQNRKRLLEQFKSTNFNKQYPSIQDNSEQSINQIEPLQNQSVQDMIKQQDNTYCYDIQDSEKQQVIENNQSNNKKMLIQFKFKTKFSQQIQSNELSNLSVEQSTKDIDIDKQITNKIYNTVETQTDLIQNENLEKEKQKPKVIDDQCQTTEDIPIQTLIIQQMKEDALKPNKQWYSINLNSSIHNKLLMTDKFMQHYKVAIDYFDQLQNKLDEN